MGTAGTGNRTKGGRIPGYDLARGLAVLVMVVLNFRGVLSGSQVYPLWLDLALEFLDRRAAAALVMISGTGITLFARRAWDRRRHKELVRRGMFLMTAGLILSMIWSGDILHVYGVLICMGACLVQRSSRVLVCVTFFFLAGAAVRWSPLFYLIEESGGVSRVWDGVSDLLFTGYFPLFPWAGIFTAGMGLGRLDIGNKQVRRVLWGLGLGLFMLAQWVSVVFGADWARIDLSLPTLPAVVSGIGSGLCLILAGIRVTDGAKVVWCRRVAGVGKTSLSFYILHILVLVALKPLFGREGMPDLVLVSAMAVLFFSLYAGTADRWLKARGRGPFEEAMRQFPFVRRFGKRSGLSSPARP